MRRLTSLLVVGMVVLPAGVHAQAPPASPPPGWYPPPLSYAPPPVEEFDGFNVPAGYHVETRPRVGLVVSGAVTLGVFYMLSVSVAARAKTSEGRWMAVPVLGPFAAMGAHEDPCATKRGTEGAWACVDADPTLELFDGIGQIIGASLLTTGLVARRSVLVPDAFPRAVVPPFWIAPSFSRGATAARATLSLVGTF